MKQLCLIAGIAVIALAQGCKPPQVAPPELEPSVEAIASALPMAAHSATQTAEGIFIGSKDKRFGIQLPPGFPMPGLQQRETDELVINMYMSKKDDQRVALFGWNRYPQLDLNDVSADHTLEQAALDAVDQMQGRATEYKLMRLKGWKGAQVWVNATSDGQQTIARYDYWIIPPYLFQIGYMTPDGRELLSEEMKGYFSSFRFGGTTAAEVKYLEPEIPLLY